MFIAIAARTCYRTIARIKIGVVVPVDWNKNKHELFVGLGVFLNKFHTRSNANEAGGE